MEFRPITLLAFAIIIVTTVNCNSEGDVLYNFRSLLSDPKNVLQSWDPTLVNPCTWFHVTCNINNSVIRVDLGSAVLSGPLPPSLGELKNLQYFELFNNNLTGRIPEELGNLKKLVSLDLYSNQLNGSIPLSLGKLINLRYLRLQENNLTGTIPKQVIDLVSLGNLRIMNVSINFLDGTIRRSKGKDFISTTIVQDPKVPSD